MPAYPTTIPAPSILGFSIKPKSSKRTMVTDRGGMRQRKMSSGHRYIGNITISFNNTVERDAFLEFFNSNLNYGDYWFSASWFDGIGFAAGEWLFRFTNISFQERGFSSSFSLPIMLRPVYAEDQYFNIDTYELIETKWPSSDLAFSETCNVLFGDNITDQGVDVTDDAVQVTYNPALTGIVATEVSFDWGDATSSTLPRIVSPLSGSPRWVNLIEQVYECGDDFFSSDTYGSAPTTSLFGVNVSAMPGSIISKPLVAQCSGYVVWDNITSDILEAIDIDSLQFGFACQQVFRVASVYPRVRIHVEFLDCQDIPLYSKIAPTVSATGVSSWQEIRIEAYVPKLTRSIRVYFEQKRGDGSISTIYSRIDNAVMAYRTCV